MSIDDYNSEKHYFSESNMGKMFEAQSALSALVGRDREASFIIDATMRVQKANFIALQIFETNNIVRIKGGRLVFADAAFQIEFANKCQELLNAPHGVDDEPLVYRDTAVPALIKLHQLPPVVVEGRTITDRSSIAVFSCPVRSQPCRMRVFSCGFTI